VETEIANVKNVKNSSDAAEIKRATEQLIQVVQQIGASVYQQQGPEAGPTPGGEQPGGEQPGNGGNQQRPGGDEDVMDGEFREQ
jgi:molecular chaperone DnaK